MRNYYLFSIIIFSVLNFCCITGSIHDLPDFKIAYIPDSDSNDIFTMNSDGTNKKLVYQDTSDSYTHYDNLFWDYKDNINYVTYSSDGGHTLYQLNPTSGERQSIFNSSKSINNLIHRPDFYCAFYLSGERILHVVNLDTKQVQQIYTTQSKAYNPLCWSSTANKLLLFTRDRNSYSIYELDLNSTAINHLVTIENMAVRPFVSPNSENIAYLGYDQHTINILNLNSLQSNTIVNSDYLLGGIVWSYDNIHLVYMELNYQPYTNNLVVINTMHSAKRKLFSVKDDLVYLCYFFPDASKFSFCTQNIDGRQDILVSSKNSANYLSLTSDQYTRNAHDGRIPHAISYNIIH